MIYRLFVIVALILPSKLAAQCSLGNGCPTEHHEVSLLQLQMEVSSVAEPAGTTAMKLEGKEVRPHWNDEEGAKVNASIKHTSHGRLNSHGGMLHYFQKFKQPIDQHSHKHFLGIEMGSDKAAFKNKENRNKGSTSRSRTKLYEDPELCALVGALGVAMMTFGAVSIRRSKREIEEIKDMESKEHTAEALLELSRKGEDLPSVCIIKGILSSTGKDVQAASPHIAGLSEKVGTIEQPKNALIEIARAVKNGDDDGKFSSIVEKQTGLKPEDIPDVEDDFTSRRVDLKESGCILSEILIQRLCVFTYKEETKTQSQGSSGRGGSRGSSGSSGQVKITIKRSPRQLSYNVFHARNVSDGLYFTDLKGKKIELQLPEADTVKQVSIGEPPSMFLATADTSTELMNYLRRDGLTVKGQHLDLSDMPPTTVGDPLTMLSKFIFLDVQSNNDLGSMGTNKQVLDALPAAYNVSTSGQFLWEPKGFYDQDNKSKFFSGATLTRRELVSSQELLTRAKKAAEENNRTTGHCEPTFTRQQLPSLRDKENCFRYTELAIPRDSPVTILAKPVKEGDGIRLVPPNAAESGRDAADPDAERYRFRILSGYDIENLIKQRELNIMQYYGIACVGAFATLFAAAGCPGMT